MLSRLSRAAAFFALAAYAPAPARRLAPAAPAPFGTIVLQVGGSHVAPPLVPLAGARTFLVDSTATPVVSDPHAGWVDIPPRVEPAVTYVGNDAGWIVIPRVPAGQRAVFVSVLGRMPAIVRVQVQPHGVDTIPVVLAFVGCNCP